MKNKRCFLLLAGLLLLAIPSGAQYGQTPPLHVDGKYLKDPHGNVVNLHGVMDTPNPYFNNYRWGNTCDNTTITKCKTYFTKLFTAITDKSSGAWCNIFRLHLDPCWTNDPNKPQTGDETGEANISRYSSVRLRNYLKLLFVPIARSAVGKGLYVVMRPPGVCPKTIQVGGEYQQYLLDVWDNVSKNADVRAYARPRFHWSWPMSRYNVWQPTERNPHRPCMISSNPSSTRFAPTALPVSSGFREHPISPTTGLMQPIP